MTVADVSVEMPNLGPDTEARWGRGFIVALGLHAVVLAFLVNWAVERVSPEAPPPAIMIDLAPTPPAPVPPQPEKPEVRPTPLPVVEKPEVVLKHVKPAHQKARSHPQVAEPENQKKKVTAPAPAAPALSASPVEAKPAVAPNYLSTLFAHLERYKRYPRVFGSRHVDLVVLVHVEISRSGQVLSLAIKKSSGSETYDRAALSTFRRAEPLPSFPPSMTQATLSLDVPVRFKRSN